MRVILSFFTVAVLRNGHVVRHDTNAKKLVKIGFLNSLYPYFFGVLSIFYT